LKRDCRGVRDLGSAGYRTGCKRLGSVTVYNHGYCATRAEAMAAFKAQ
jgi:hypothetical protein